jgi:ribosomal protein S18 acetylase RimI-like enzyme
MKQIETGEASVRIRCATADDLRTLSIFGTRLAELHVSFDDRRFVSPDPPEPVFFEFFESQIARPDAALLIADLGATPVGYAFVRMEAESIEDLRGASAWLHDIFVAPEARGRGVGKRLVEAAIDAARRLGSSNLMLSVSPSNAPGKRLFESLGLRTTMIEMRIELGESGGE